MTTTRSLQKNVDPDTVTRELIKKQIISTQPSYRSPKNYYNWNDYIDHFVETYAVAFERTQNSETKEERNLAHNAVLLLERVIGEAAPAIYLSSELYQALAETKLPKLTKEHKVPLRQFHLMLPTGAFISGNKPVSIACCVLHNEDSPVDGDIQWPDGSKTGYAISCAISHGTRALPLTCWFNDTGTKYHTVPNLNYLPSSYDDDDNLNREVLGFYFELQRRALALVIHAVLIMQYQPELLTTTPASTSGAGFSAKKRRTEDLPLRWLGRDYRRTQASEAPAGSHASPRAHWRKGHWHHFRCGKGRQKLKLQWVEPVFVNA